jgi:hypothetical protein
MKKILRGFLINLGAIMVTSNLLSGFTITGGTKGLIIAALALMIIILGFTIQFIYWLIK